MRYLIIPFILLFFTILDLWGYEVRVISGDSKKIQINKYYLGDTPVWDDAEKQKMLDEAVDTGTGTIKDSDFIAVVLLATETTKISDLESQDKVKNRTQALKDMGK